MLCLLFVVLIDVRIYSIVGSPRSATHIAGMNHEKPWGYPSCRTQGCSTLRDTERWYTSQGAGALEFRNDPKATGALPGDGFLVTSALGDQSALKTYCLLLPVWVNLTLVDRRALLSERLLSTSAPAMPTSIRYYSDGEVYAALGYNPIWCGRFNPLCRRNQYWAFQIRSTNLEHHVVWVFFLPWAI